jgi:tRNA pseudouridine55 synthase
MTARAIDGVLLLDKPPGLSSNAALQEAKRLVGARKAGHAGTLDPLASGLLPLLFGEATRFARFALEADKTYVATVRLGTRTDSGDAEGRVLECRPVAVDEARIAGALARFRGELFQVPPMHSALKHEGRRLYALARAGRVIARPARRVFVHEIELLERSAETLVLRIRCSKGTYVRQIAADLGETLGCGAHLAALRRVAAGGFRVEEAIGLAALGALDVDARRSRLLPTERLIEALPAVELAPAEARRFARGQAVAADPTAPGLRRVRAAGAGLLGVGTVGPDGLLRPARLLARAPEAAATG